MRDPSLGTYVVNPDTVGIRSSHLLVRCLGALLMALARLIGAFETDRHASMIRAEWALRA